MNCMYITCCKNEPLALVTVLITTCDGLYICLLSSQREMTVINSKCFFVVITNNIKLTTTLQ